MNDSERTWTAPYGKPVPDPEHKSCWDCANMVVAGFPMRKCLKGEGLPEEDDSRYIHGGNARAEIHDDLFGTGTGRTVADDCSDFEGANDRRNENLFPFVVHSKFVEDDV